MESLTGSNVGSCRLSDGMPALGGEATGTEIGIDIGIIGTEGGTNHISIRGEVGGTGETTRSVVGTP